MVSKEGDATVRKMTGGSPHLLRTLVQMDAPDHPKYRVLTQSWFLPQNIRRLEDRIRQIAREHADRMADLGGECDFVKDVALTFPLRVIMEILGVPPADEPRMLKLTQELFGAADPELNRSKSLGEENPDPLGDIQAVVADFFSYFKQITDERKARPGSDLATVIANGSIDGAPINDFEAMGYYVIVATAGHDTTSSSTAGAVWGMCQFPEAFAAVKGDPSLIPGLVDESVRWITPVKHFMRSATEGRGGRRPQDRQGRLAHALLPLRQPGAKRRCSRAPDEFLPGPQPQPAPGLRLRRAPVPRPALGQDGDAHPVRGDHAAAEVAGVRRRTPAVQRRLRRRPQTPADPLRHAPGGVPTGPRVAVAGAGALGSLCALLLARAGARVTWLDPCLDQDGRTTPNASAVAAGMLAPACEALFDPISPGRSTCCAKPETWVARPGRFGRDRTRPAGRPEGRRLRN